MMTLLLSGWVGLIVAAAADVKNRIIPDGLVFFVTGIGLMLRAATGLTSIGLSLMGAGIVFVALVLLAHRNFIGGGDAKLIAAVTFLVPPNRIVPLLLSIALAGGLLSCICLGMLFFAKNRHPSAGRFISRLFRRGPNRIKARKPLPYALAILGGATACILSEVLQCLNATSCSL